MLLCYKWSTNRGYQATLFLLQLVSSAAEAGAVLAGSDGDACREPEVLTSALGAGERAAWKAPAFDRAFCACSCWIVGIGPGTPSASTPRKNTSYSSEEAETTASKKHRRHRTRAHSRQLIRSARSSQVLASGRHSSQPRWGERKAEEQDILGCSKAAPDQPTLLTVDQWTIILKKIFQDSN